jgi:hypothetical protein
MVMSVKAAAKKAPAKKAKSAAKKSAPKKSATKREAGEMTPAERRQLFSIFTKIDPETNEVPNPKPELRYIMERYARVGRQFLVQKKMSNAEKEKAAGRHTRKWVMTEKGQELYKEMKKEKSSSASTHKAAAHKPAAKQPESVPAE